MILNLDAAFLLSVSIDHHTWIESCEKKQQLFYDRQMYAFFLSKGCLYKAVYIFSFGYSLVPRFNKLVQ